MQEFNKVTTTSNFIKELLNTTYLPTVRTVLPGDFVIEDRVYILHCSIIRCTESGYLLPYSGSTLSPVAKFITIGEYHFGEKNDRLCHNFQSNNEGYDSLTHEILGKYLRSLRDMYGLNLMPLYNCFSNNSFPNHHVLQDRIAKTSRDYQTKLYKVPIRFNTDYTICIDNLDATTIAPAFIRNNNLVKMGKNNAGATTDITNEYIAVHTNDVISTYYGLRFYDPIKVRFNNIPEQIVKSGVEYTAETGYDIQEIKISLSPASNFFKIKEYVSLADIKSDLHSVYILNDSTGKLQQWKESDGFTKGNVYFYCSINPSELGWSEKVDEVQNGSVTITGDTYDKSSDTYYHVDKTYYKIVTTLKPVDIIYNVTEDHCNKYDFVEDTLYMLIQVPEEFDRNIVILEGNYTHTQSVKIFNDSELGKYPDNILDNLFIKNLRLMRLNGTKLTPFSDTLMQFLLWHAISNLDTINLDMDRLHSDLTNLYYTPDRINYANYWFYRYRQYVSDFAQNNHITFIDDNLGYVTTEIEAAMNGVINDYQS